MSQRGNFIKAEAPAQLYRCTSAMPPKRQRDVTESSAANSRRQLGDVEAASLRRRRFVATSKLRLDVAGCSSLSRL
jgi:hypothetical protein